VNKYSFQLQKFIPIIFFFLLYNLFAIDFTKKEADFTFKGEYNRALAFSAEFSALSVFELNGRYAVKGGLALGSTGGGADIKMCIQGGIRPLLKIPLYASLAYIYNGLPEYETHQHTLLPVVSFEGQRAGIAVGISLLFTSFFGEKALFESILSFSAYFNFINNEKMLIGISIANFNDFYAGLWGSYFLALNSQIRFSKKWSLINGIEVLQSGSTALTANFYGIVYRAGIKIIW